MDLNSSNVLYISNNIGKGMATTLQSSICNSSLMVNNEFKTSLNSTNGDFRDKKANISMKSHQKSPIPSPKIFKSYGLKFANQLSQDNSRNFQVNIVSKVGNKSRLCGYARNIILITATHDICSKRLLNQTIYRCLSDNTLIYRQKSKSIRTR